MKWRLLIVLFMIAAGMTANAWINVRQSRQIEDLSDAIDHIKAHNP